MKKKWIQAIRRDEGKDLKISDSTKVCSRHFRDFVVEKINAFTCNLTTPGRWGEVS